MGTSSFLLLQNKEVQQNNFTAILTEYSDTQGNLTTETVNVGATEPIGETAIALSSGSIKHNRCSLKAGDFVKFIIIIKCIW